MMLQNHLNPFVVCFVPMHCESSCSIFLLLFASYSLWGFMGVIKWPKERLVSGCDGISSETPKYKKCWGSLPRHQSWCSELQIMEQKLLPQLFKIDLTGFYHNFVTQSPLWGLMRWVNVSRDLKNPIISCFKWIQVKIEKSVLKLNRDLALTKMGQTTRKHNPSMQGYLCRGGDKKTMRLC